MAKNKISIINLKYKWGREAMATDGRINQYKFDFTDSTYIYLSVTIHSVQECSH